jgi:hypothetical protein
MILRNNFSPLILLLFIVACGPESEQETIHPGQTPIDALMNKVFEAHGELGDFSFDFRENSYTFSINDDNEFSYSKTVITDSTLTVDVLTNEFFERSINGEPQELNQLEINKYSESLNSVIYFTCSPLNLSDPAVNIDIKPDKTIKEQAYDVIEVTFDAEGGGTDHEDIFYYWFNKETHIMDYMAYSYNVNGGGVRFRSAYNSRMVAKMRFQDYVNYGAPVGTPLESLPGLFEQGELEELSRIEMVNVSVLIN